MPDPALPDQTNPALRTVKMASPLARESTSRGMALRADSGWEGSARKEERMRALFVH